MVEIRQKNIYIVKSFTWHTTSVHREENFWHFADIYNIIFFFTFKLNILCCQYQPIQNIEKSWNSRINVFLSVTIHDILEVLNKAYHLKLVIICYMYVCHRFRNFIEIMKFCGNISNGTYRKKINFIFIPKNMQTYFFISILVHWVMKYIE